MLTKEDFAGRLKTAIDSKKIKQADLAKSIDVSTANISNYVNGKAFPPIDTLAKIAKKLDISLDWLCGTERQERAETVGEVARSIMRVLNSLPNSCELETIQIYENAIAKEEEIEEMRIALPAITFNKNSEICIFLEDLIKMRKLLDESVFDCNFYERWLSDRIQTLNNIQLIQGEWSELEDDEGLPF